MKLKKTLLLNLVLAIAVSSFVLLLAERGVFRHLELTSLDFSFHLRGKMPYSPRIIIIEISDSDIAAIGRWPWQRSWQAAMVRALSRLGAKYIYFDIIFSEASDEKDDLLLEESIKEAGSVYLPFVFQDTAYDISNAVMPLKRFSSFIRGTGAVNIYPDIDGTLRRIPLVFQNKDEIYPHIALQIAADYTGTNIREVNSRYLTLYGKNAEIKIPLVEKNKMLLNWAGDWQNTFKHYSFLEILAAYKDIQDGKLPLINAGYFKDSICMVALTAIGLYDIKPIPLQPEYPAIGVVATAISDILEKKFLYTPAGWLNILILYLLCLIPAFLIFGEKPLKETVFIFLLGINFILANFLLFKNGIRINLATPMIALMTTSLTVGTYNFVRVAMERQNFFKMAVTDGLTGLFNIRYFKMLLETEIMMASSDPTKQFTIIMNDIDHFKKFNDTYGHQVGDLVIKEVAAVLKTSVRVSDVAARYGGEEMIVLLRGTPLKDGLLVGEKLRKNVEAAMVKDQDNTYKVTSSFGIATFHSGDTVDSIIKRADDGLYRAKESGRNRACSVEECA